MDGVRGWGKGSRGLPSRGGRWASPRSSAYRPRPSDPEPTPAPPFGKLLETLNVSSLVVPSNSEAKIRGCEYIASFNWLQGANPVILIPGMPPKWKPLPEPEQIEFDSGNYYCDINAAHYPAHPIEPAARAVLLQNPKLLTTAIDIFACGSTIGNLLRVVRGVDKPFRFVVEQVGETTIFVRRENSPKEMLQGVTGCGHTFPARYTEWDKSTQKSDSHQRLIRYEFSGFDCIVRSETDGYLETETSDVAEAAVEELPDLDGLSIRKSGGIVPHASIFDLKTRSAWKQEDVLDGELPRLWVRQIENFILAKHTRGTFYKSDILVRNVRGEMNTWEEEHQEDLRRLGALIARIVVRARDGPKIRFEVCCRDKGIIDFREVGGDFPPALPDDLHRKWAGCRSPFAHDEDAESEGDEWSDGRVSPNAEGGVEVGSDDGSDPDYTACSEKCGYCGRCKY